MQTQDYAIYIKDEDGNGAYLSVRGRTQWKIRTARKHLKDVNAELMKGDPKWQSTLHFALVMV